MKTDRPSGGRDADTRTTDGGVSLRVYKERRLLSLYRGGALIAEYRVDLGAAPVGHKQREGDGKTPEGAYTVCTRNENSKFYRSLGLSYPNGDDAAKAMAAGLIDREACAAIQEAEDNGRRPPWDTPLGGAIMIHGMGTGRDWTAGCIAVANETMDILWRCCPLGTPVTVYP